MASSIVPLSGLSAIAVDAAITASSNYVTERALSLLDRVEVERIEETMLGILRNPPVQSDAVGIHREYRRSANKALSWAEQNLSSEEYDVHVKKYVDYLRTTTPKDDGVWSGGHFFHCYSQGSPDLSWKAPAWRILMEIGRVSQTFLATIRMIPNYDDLERRRADAELRKHDAACHEYDFQVKYGIATESSSPHFQLEMFVDAFKEAGASVVQDLTANPKKVLEGLPFYSLFGKPEPRVPTYFI